MNRISFVTILMAVASMVLGFVSRITMRQFMGIESEAMYMFANTCLLLSIAVSLLEKKK